MVALDSDPPTVSSKFLVTIETTGPAVFKRPYPLPLKYRDEVKRQIDDMCKQGIISPSASPYNAPLVPVAKPNNGVRICLDFRGLNNNIVEDKYPLPNIQLISAQLGKS